MNDSDLAEVIRKAFLRDDTLSFHPIEVKVHEGVVTLTGVVQSFRRKASAEELASSFESCRGVINELRVEPPGPISDEEIAGYVRAALDAHSEITPESIEVTVVHGKVTLSGQVATPAERAVAEDVAMSARGVRTVENLLLIDPVEAVSDAHLASEIKQAIEVTRGLRMADIRVSVASNIVVLTGQVGDLSQKEMAERVARRFGVHRVRNDIEVL